MKETISGCSIFSGLTAAYISSQTPNEVTALFGGMFNTKERFAERIATVQQLNYPRQDLADVLKVYNSKVGSGSQALENIEALRLEGTQVVITGQQAGIFGGPLYTVYKAVTAVKLARQLSKEQGIAVVPLFWVASEDHDYEEISTVSYLSGDRLKVAELAAEHHGKRSIGDVKLGNALKTLTEMVLDDVEMPSQQRLMEDLFKNTQVEGESLSEWFARIMALLFKEHGLVMIDPMLEGVRTLQKEAFIKAFERRESIRKALDDATEAVKRLGYEPGIRPVEGNAQMFLYYEGERLPLKEDATGLFVESRGIKRSFTHDQIRSLIENQPQSFSTNVVLRPVFQDRLLPVIAYVGGPGEIAYYGQLGGVFASMDMTMPVVYPRETFTLIPEITARALKSIEMAENEMEAILCGGLARKKASLLEEADSVHIDEVLNTFIRQFDQDYGVVLEKICGINEELREMAEKNNGIIHSQFEYLRDKAHRFHRKNNKELLKQLDRIGNVLKPSEKLQERELSVLSFVAEWGDELVDLLLNRLPLSHMHRMVEPGAVDQRSVV